MTCGNGYLPKEDLATLEESAGVSCWTHREGMLQKTFTEIVRAM